MFKIPKKYRRLFQRLSHFDLQATGSPATAIDAADILTELTEKKRSPLFLNFYSESGIRKALEHYGIFNQLRLRGFRNFIIQLDTSETFRHTVKIFFEESNPNKLLGEMYARHNIFIPKPDFSLSVHGQKFTLIFIEWLLLQNPRAKFSARRPPLPGQIYPGLKIGKKILPLLINMAQRLKSDGLMNVPENFHNAVFYSHYFKFFDPQKEGLFAALQRDLKNYGLTVAAWATFLNCVRNKKTTEIFEWFSEEQLLPLNEKLISYLTSADYVERKETSQAENEFFIDTALLEQRLRNQPVAEYLRRL